MSIFSGIFKARDKPIRDSTAGSGYRFFFGGSTSGKAVTERSAMQMTAVYCCVRILAEAIAGLPIHMYRYKADGGKEKALDHPLYLLLHDEPNPEMSSFVFRETLMTQNDAPRGALSRRAALTLGAGLPLMAHAREIPIIEVTPMRTDLSHLADVVIEDTAQGPRWKVVKTDDRAA